MGRELIGSGGEGPVYLPFQFAFFQDHAALFGAGEAEDVVKEHGDLVLEFGSGLEGHSFKDLPFPCRIADGNVVLLFVLGDLFDKLEALQIKFNELIVEGVDL